MLIPYSIIILAGAPFAALLLYFTVLRSRKIWSFRFTTVGRRDFTRQVLSVLLMGFFAVGRLFRADNVYGQLGLEAEDAVLPAAEMLPTALVFWFGLLTVGMAILAPFFRKRELHDYMAFLAPVSVVLSALHLRQLFTVTTGDLNPLAWRNLLFIIELALTGIIAVSELLLLLRRRAFGGGWRRLRANLGFLLTYVSPFMPSWFLGLVLGATGGDPSGFSLSHRLLLYLGVFVIFYFYITLRNKSYDERNFALIALSASAFFNYFSVMRAGLSGLPLHLCNTAIMMMLVTYVFRWKGMFYFTYLVNVLGAFFAIVLPNTSELLTEPGTVIFWYNHIYAFALPILGVALAIFPKPNFKMVTRAIGVFTLYFLTVLILDGWFNNASFNTTGTTVDYFFLYSTFYVDKFAFTLPLYKPWDVIVGGQLIRFFPLYQLTIYVIFVAAMF
ncbi:MAG: YwaF family protein, partial [Clostridia bacterium]|nr:YwaF family protein [Clostridia bacterium]